MIRNCPTCLEFPPAKPKIKKKDMLHHEVPSTLWTKLATDIFHFQGANYLVLVDYTSKFLVVKQLRKIDQRAVTTALEEIFTERGYPDELVSDNGPCYRGEQFHEFLRRKGIKHTTSSPYYPQSNGLAEAYVKVIKNMMKKAQKCKVRFNDMLYQYRTSPVAGKKESPIELLEQRRPRTNMPYLGKEAPKTKPKPIPRVPKVNTHSYPIGTKVVYRAGPDPNSTYHCTWYPAKVTSLLEEPKSYLLENNEGKEVRRTEQHIRPYEIPRRVRAAIESFGRTANGGTHSVMIRPKHRPEMRNTTTDRWQNRNLRPTPPRINGHGENSRFTPPPNRSPHRSPDSELRRSSRIQARRSLSDTD